MIKRHTISIKNAANGLIWAFRTQPNYKVHLFLSIVAIIAARLFKISFFEFLVICLVIFGGLVVETLNTAVEATTDAIDDKWRDDIRIAKDVSAAAMLVYALGALVIAALIFIPRLFVF